MLWEAMEDPLQEEIRKERLSKLQGESGLLGDIRDALIPFRVGDRVSVTIGGRQYGNGLIKEISTEWDRGQGTKLYPAYFVELSNGHWGWVNGVSLSRTMQRSTSEDSE